MSYLARNCTVVAEKVDKHGRGGYETPAGRRIKELAGKELPWWNIHEAEPLRWSVRVARFRVEWWLQTKATGTEPLVLLGRKVIQAFRVPSEYEWLEWFRSTEHAHPMIAFPHPSGLNRWWNDPVNEEAARMMLRRLANGELPAFYEKRTK